MSRRNRTFDPMHLGELMAHLCATGDERGCEALATYQYFGLGVTADPDRARGTFAELCRQGNQTACHAERGYLPLIWLVAHFPGATWTYPREAINAGLVRNRSLPNDRVSIGFCVAADGSAAQTVILDSSGNEDVDDGAAKGVRSWRFPNRPAIAREDVCMHVTFVLHGDSR